MNLQCKRIVIKAALVGFVLPLVWGGFEMVLFNAHDSFLTAALLIASRVTCPAWLLHGFWGDIGSPFLNAILYGALALIFCMLRSRSSSQNRSAS